MKTVQPRNCFGLIKNICTEHDYDLFKRNYFETSHAKGPQDAACGFLKNQVDLAVYRGSEIIQSASNFFNYCENHLKDTKSIIVSAVSFTILTEKIDRNNISFKAIPGIRRLYQVVSTKSNNDTLI